MAFRALWICFVVCYTGCTGLFLRPDHINYFPKVDEYFVVEEGDIPVTNPDKLHFWYLPPQIKKNVRNKPLGIVVQVHGNAQNLSSHVQSLLWLTELGYGLFVFDYRGYGESTGSLSIDWAYQDVALALDYVTKRFSEPIIFYGQSLGATLLLKAVSRHPRRWRPALVVAEAPFYSFPQIAKEKLSQAWLTWPFQLLPYLLVSNRYGLNDNELASVTPTPVLLFHSIRDPIVPAHNTIRIFAQLSDPKEMHIFEEPGHIHAMHVRRGQYRKVLLETIKKHSPPQLN